MYNKNLLYNFSLHAAEHCFICFLALWLLLQGTVQVREVSDGETPGDTPGSGKPKEAELAGLMDPSKERLDSAADSVPSSRLEV